MSEGVSEMARTDSWSGLLEETRQALSTLRAEDLEELAKHAQTMFKEVEGQQERLLLNPEDLVKLTREHHLLGDLLQATERNLKVLRRLRDRERTGEVNSRWVR
jgi:uncharacterized protein YmfQ (DUF2313 family)